MPYLERGDTMKEYDKWQNFKITEQERQQLKKDAHEHNMNISEYIRYLVAKERKEREK